MTCIEISELNGRVGNTDYWQKSRQAEHEILKVVSRLIQRPIQQNEIQGRHVCDFVTAQGVQGDVKIWSGSKVKVELQQTHRSGTVPGWYHAYDKLTHFGGLITINHWHSAYLGTGVFKARWIPWKTIQTGVVHARHMKSRTGEWCELNIIGWVTLFKFPVCGMMHIRHLTLTNSMPTADCAYLTCTLGFDYPQVSNSLIQSDCDSKINNPSIMFNLALYSFNMDSMRQIM